MTKATIKQPKTIKSGEIEKDEERRRDWEKGDIRF
jgi:hypothetical protein